MKPETERPRLLHRHHWQETGHDYVPPTRGFSLKGLGFDREHVVEDLVYGYTTVSMRCLECGDVATRRVQGRFVASETKGAEHQ